MAVSKLLNHPLFQDHGDDVFDADDIVGDDGVYQIRWDVKRSALRHMAFGDKLHNLFYLSSDDEFVFALELFLKDPSAKVLSMNVDIRGATNIRAHCAVSAISVDNDVLPLGAVCGATDPNVNALHDLIETERILQENNRYLKGEKLRLLLEIRICEVRIVVRSQPWPRPPSRSNTMVGVTLNAGGISYPVLVRDFNRATSWSFNRLIRSYGISHSRNSLVIRGMDGRSLKEMVLYIMDGTLPVLDMEIAKYLLVASAFFRMSELKAACFDFLKASISEDTVMDLLFFALNVRNDELYKECMEFVSRPEVDNECIKSWRGILLSSIPSGKR